MSKLARCVLVAAAFAATVSAQGIDLRVDGGSSPGQLDATVSGGVPFSQGAIILLSVTTGPTPLAWIDPADPRSLRVGLELASIAQAGPFFANGAFSMPTLSVPNLPTIIDNPLYFQAVSLPGNPTIVDQVSLPRAVRFGPSGTFRDRFVATLNPRSFVPVLPSADGRVLLAGGGAGALFAQVARQDTEWFDPMTDTFTQGPNMTVHRSIHTATRLLDGRWLLVGGVDQRNDPHTAAEIYDPVAGTFTAVASMATPRMGHTATLLPNGKVLVTGGITDLNAPSSPIDPIYSITRTTEIYDPVANTWTAGPLLRKPRAGHSAIARADGRVLLASGVSWTTIIIRLPTMETSSDLYDPVANTIAAGPTLRQARAQGTTTSLGNGRWLLVGGIGTISLTQQGTPTATAEIYDETANSFTATGSMAQQRALHDVFPLGNGRYLVVGGGDGTLFALTPLGSSEIFNVATGTFAAGPTLTRPRTAFGAYTTATGQFHMVGGDGPNGVDMTTEFYFR